MVSAVSSQVASLGSGTIPFGAGATANTGATDSSANGSPAAIHALRATHQKIDPNIASAADDAQVQVRQAEDQSSESGLQVVANLAQPPSAPSIAATA